MAADLSPVVIPASESKWRSGIAGRALVGFASERGLVVRLEPSASTDENGEATAPAALSSRDQELSLLCSIASALDGEGGEERARAGLALGERYRPEADEGLRRELAAADGEKTSLSHALQHFRNDYGLARLDWALEDGACQVVLAAQELPLAVQRCALLRDAVALARLLEFVLGGALTNDQFSATLLRGPTSEDLGDVGEDAFGRLRLRWLDDSQGKSPRLQLVLSLRDRADAVLSQPANAPAPAADLSASQGQIADLVFAQLLAEPKAAEGMDAIAQSLGMSPRTLRRRLAGAGVGYRALLARARLVRARELLRDGAMSLREIADYLGYADTSSFHHSFRRQMGVTPCEFQRGAEGDETLVRIDAAE